MQQTPINTHTKRVHFNRDVEKVHADGSPSLTLLHNNSTFALNDTTNQLAQLQTPLLTPKVSRARLGAVGSKDNCITVGIRVKPLCEKDKAQENHIKTVNKNEVHLVDRTNNVHMFTCDYCFHDEFTNSTQEFVYECIGAPMLKHAFDGYNVCVFAYGQTGSGKTYSMIGTNENNGIIPRFIQNLFDLKTKNQIETQIEISYYEIYNEKIYDLLCSSSNDPKTSHIQTTPSTVNALKNHLKIREDPRTGPYIVDLLTISIDRIDDLILWFNIGNKRRATACTNMNEKSSRSHCVFQIQLTQYVQCTNESTQVLTSKVNLVDLAGSERLQATNNYKEKNASRFKESTAINTSLLTLGKIICILSERSSAASNTMTPTPNTQKTHLPYRESSLTWLLKESLGGNSKTSMLATINSTTAYIDETLCTLRYAAKTARIKNTAMLNRNRKMDDLSSDLDQMKKSVFNENLLAKIQNEWKLKLDEADKRKEEELKSLKKQLIQIYENENQTSNCCLINLTEDMLFSEKLIYMIKGDEKQKLKKLDDDLDAKCESVLITNSCFDTIIGSDRDVVDINLRGSLIAPIHAKITQNTLTEEVFIEQLDKIHATYVNGEKLADKKLLNHGDRIIFGFGGSHYFRFNNPIRTQQKPLSSGKNEFKDYQYARNELEVKQSEIIKQSYEIELSKCKLDSDLKLKTERDAYQQNIERIKNDLENEKQTSKQKIEQIKCESAKKIKIMAYTNLKLKSKLNLMEVINDKTPATASNGSSSSSANTSTSTLYSVGVDSITAHVDDLIEQIKAKKHDVGRIGEETDRCLYEKTRFNLFLKLNEANNMCAQLNFNYEFQLKPVYNNTQKCFIQCVCVVNKLTKFVTLWQLDFFNEKLLQLNDVYMAFTDENEAPNEDAVFNDCSYEWQDMDAFMKHIYYTDEELENIFNKTKCGTKRRLSNSSTTSSASLASASIDDTKKFCSNEHSYLARSTQSTTVKPVKCVCDEINATCTSILKSLSKKFYISDLVYENCEKILEFAVKSQKNDLNRLRLVACVQSLYQLDQNLVNSNNFLDFALSFIENSSITDNLVAELVDKLVSLLRSHGKNVVKHGESDVTVQKDMILNMSLSQLKMFCSFFDGVYGEFKCLIGDYVKIFDKNDLNRPNFDVVMRNSINFVENFMNFLTDIDECHHNMVIDEATKEIDENYLKLADYVNFLIKISSLLKKSKLNYDCYSSNSIDLIENLSSILKITIKFYISTSKKANQTLIDTFLLSFKQLSKSIKF